MSDVLGEAERLAIAVLRGDTQAALALADLVLETYRRAGDVAAWAARDKPLTGLLSTRAWGVLWFQKKAETLGGLADMTADDLLALGGFGEKSLAAVRRVLAAHGLKLRGDP